MIDNLKCDFPSMQLMEYIKRIESIYIPEPTLIDTPFKKYGSGKLTADERERRNNMPLGFTMCMEIFVERYNTNAFLNQLTYDNYIKNDTIQELVHFLELDVDKFWLLILFVYDYCNSTFFEGTTLKANPLEQLHQFVELIDKGKENMQLTLKAGKQKVTVDSTLSLRFIANAIEKSLNESDLEALKELNCKMEAEEEKCLKDSPIIAYLGKIFLTFFNCQPQIRNKRKKGANHSIKEVDLVCQLIHFTGISKEKCWLVRENDYLKSFLKQYKDYDYPDYVSSVYPEFSI